MTSEENNGKMSSSETRSPLVAKDDDEIPEEVSDDDVSEQEEPNSTEENDYSSEDEDEAAASDAVNPLSSDAAQILPLLQNLLLNNDIQRERLIGLIQLYDHPTAANVVNTEGEQIAREEELSSQAHLLEQSVQMLEEEIENQKKQNAQLEEQIKRLTNSSDP